MVIGKLLEIFLKSKLIDMNFKWIVEPLKTL